MFRAFIIGNGPSLNEIELSWMMYDATFTSNDFRLKWNELVPDYWVIDDPHYFDMYRTEIFQMANNGLTNVYGADLIYPDGWTPPAHLHSYQREGLHHLEPAFMPYQPFWSVGTVTYIMMQLAWSLGFTDQILVGIDTLEPRPRLSQHFADNYGTRLMDPNERGLEPAPPNLWRDGYECAKTFFKENGGRLRLANGTVDIFERVDYDDLFRAREIQGSMGQGGITVQGEET